LKFSGTRFNQSETGYLGGNPCVTDGGSSGSSSQQIADVWRRKLSSAAWFEIQQEIIGITMLSLPVKKKVSFGMASDFS